MGTVSLAIGSRRVLGGVVPAGGSGDASVGMSALASLVTVCAVASALTWKVALNVWR